MRARVLFVAIALILGVAVFAVACGEEEEKGGAPTATEGGAGAQVEVLLDEWSVVANPATVSAGPVTFTAINQGEEDHELVIVKTDLAPDALPVVDGKVDEAAAGQDIGEIEKFASGGEESATFDLEPGSYVLFCNIVEEEESGEKESHYEEGMHTAFTVTE